VIASFSPVEQGIARGVLVSIAQRVQSEVVRPPSNSGVFREGADRYGSSGT